jgi:hypothetical protein
VVCDSPVVLCFNSSFDFTFVIYCVLFRDFVCFSGWFVCFPECLCVFLGGFVRFPMCVFLGPGRLVGGLCVLGNGRVREFLWRFSVLRWVIFVRAPSPRRRDTEGPAESRTPPPGTSF